MCKLFACCGCVFNFSFLSDKFTIGSNFCFTGACWDEMELPGTAAAEEPEVRDDFFTAAL